jgi:hypothetical protein
MKRLLSDNLWPELAKLSKNHGRMWAAISYVTTKRYLNFRKGDFLICDASDASIKAGMTSAAALRSLFQSGAKIYSFDGLHTKLLVIDEMAVIGSANLSENAGVNTCEASLLTDDLQVLALIQGFIEQLRHSAIAVDKNFLKRIEAIPVEKFWKGPKRKLKSIASDTSRLWLVGTQPIGSKIMNREVKFVEAGKSEASKKLKKGRYEIDYIRWAGQSKFRAEAKPGDLVIQVFRQKMGKRVHIEVYRAAPILHRQDEGNWTRFYLEVPADNHDYYPWKEFKSDLVRLGFENIKPGSTREITERASAVLACML